MEPLELIFAKSKSEKHNATNPAVEVRNYPNTMNDYKVPWRGSDEEIAKSQRVPLTEVTAPRVALWCPPEFLEHSFPNSTRFIKSAIKLKKEVVQATWMRNGPRVEDPTMYTGVLGTAFMCFKAYLTTGSAEELVLFSEIVDSCCAAAPTAPELFTYMATILMHNVTFLKGQPGIYAMGAVAAKFRNDRIRRDFYLEHFNRVRLEHACWPVCIVGGVYRRELHRGRWDEMTTEHSAIPNGKYHQGVKNGANGKSLHRNARGNYEQSPAVEGISVTLLGAASASIDWASIMSYRLQPGESCCGGSGLPYELLNGRVGFLYAALFINRYLAQETVPWSITGPVVDAVLACGCAHATPKCPLMYPWKSFRYWGAAHGLAGIVQILLHFPLKELDPWTSKPPTLHDRKSVFPRKL